MSVEFFDPLIKEMDMGVINNVKEYLAGQAKYAASKMSDSVSDLSSLSPKQIVQMEEKRSELPVYMFFTTLLVLFGFYSYMTPEKFLLTRLRKGKATLASLVIPMIMMCVYMVLKSLRDDKKTDFRIYILLFMLNTAGCLCSSLGAVLCAVPPVLCALFSCIMSRKFRHVLPLLASCVPCVLMAAFLRFAV